MRVPNKFPDPQDRGNGDPDARHFARQIDCLVAGDLDDTDRAALLRWLDAEPGRWRRCGLAFLEAQAIRESLAEWNENPRADTAAREVIGVSAATEFRDADYASVAKAPPSRPGVGRGLPSWWMAAAAAAVLLAFTLGWAGGRSSQVANVAGTPGATVQPTVATATRSHSAEQADPVSQGSSSPLPAAFAQGSVRGTPVIRIRTGDGPDVREIILPVAEKPALQDLAAAGRQVIPEYVRAQWERQGYQVVEDRRLMPLKLADGRNVVMSVSRVTLNYVGRPSL